MGTKKPETQSIGGYTLRAVRPPTPRLRFWYWRIDNTATSRVVERGRWSKEEAQQRLGALVASGRPAGEVRSVGDCDTLYDLLCYWLAAKQSDSRLAESSKTRVLHAKRRLVGTADGVTRLGRHRLSSLSSDDLESWFHRQVASGRSAKSVANDVLHVLEAVAWGRRKRLHHRSRDEFDRSYLRGARKHGHNSRVKYTPSRAELAALRQKLVEWAGERPNRLEVVDLFDLQLGTGARIGEAAALTPRDALERPFRLRFGAGASSKTGERLTLVSRRTFEIVRRRSVGRRRGERIFDCSIEALKVAMNRELRRAAEELGLPRVTSHALRRAVVDRYIRRSADVKAVARQLGHTVGVMLEDYRRATERDALAALEAAELDVLPSGEVVDFQSELLRRGS
jgi:integrase